MPTNGYYRNAKRAARFVSDVSSGYNNKGYLGAAEAVAARLFVKDKKAGAAQRTAAVSLQGTKMKKYLDRTYEKKCGVEIKHQLFASGPIALSTTLTMVNQWPYNLQIPQSLTDQGRDGNTVEIKRLHIRFTLQGLASQTLGTRVRLFLVRGKTMVAGVQPNVNQILNTTTDIRSEKPRHDELQANFTVLKEFQFNVGTPASGRDRHDFSYTLNTKKCMSIVWLDSDTTGAVNAIIQGSIFLYAMYETNGVASIPNLYIYTDFEFVDP